jgi:hypothetical protein
VIKTGRPRCADRVLEEIINMSKVVQTTGAFAVLLSTGFVIFVCCATCNGRQVSPRIAKLIDDSKQKKCFVYSDFDRNNPLTAEDALNALDYVKSHQDYNSYFLLLVLRTHYPAVYNKLGKDVRASVLCSALENTLALNDWGILSEKDSFDNEAARALLEAGEVSLKYLKPLLDNDKPALLNGSQAATRSIADKYRRKDYAYRYASLILGQTPAYSADPKKRDKDIENLIKKLN